MTDLFIDFEPDGRAPNMAEGARVGAVRYRQRPKDSGCLHEQVDFRKVAVGIVDCVCLGCGLGWRSVKVVAP